MRKGVFLFIAVIVLLMPLPAHAQSTTVTFDSLNIQLWPDYDQPSVLVIYDFTVSAGVPLPAQVHLRLPADAQILAVARQDSGGLINVEYQIPLGQNEVSFTVTDRSQYHIEFYSAYTRDGKKRNFGFTWPGDYAVTTLKIVVQEPVGAANLSVAPPMTRSGPMEDGFVYQSISINDLAQGQSAQVKLSYSKATDDLSSASLGVQPVTPLDQSISGQNTLMSWLPWLLGGFGGVLLLGGGIWYWLSGRSVTQTARLRKKHTAPREAPGGEIYCAQCGKRAQPGDHFCRACGAKLRAQE